jgi:hypothetical protein
MIARSNILSPALVALAAMITLVETIWFASLQPGYGHVTHTISELGATGAVHARLVAYGFFLPVGLLVWLALWLVYLEVPDREVLPILFALSFLGLGYAMSAFFPCDPGGPFFGTWRTQVHNVLGFIDYLGTGIGLLLAARYFMRRNATLQAVTFLIAGTLVLIGLALLSTEAALHFHVRGLIQRITEVFQFTGVFFVCLLLNRHGNQHKQTPLQQSVSKEA